MSERRDHPFLDLVDGYVLGTLDPQDEARFLDHLSRDCPTCEEALRGIADAPALLAATAPPKALPRSLRDRVLRAVEERAGDSRRPVVRQRPAFFLPSWTPWALAAVLAVAVTSLAVLTSRMRAERDRSEALVARLQEAGGALADSLARSEELLDLLRDPGALCYAFQTTPDAPAGLLARAIYHAGSRRAFVALESEGLADDRDFELWAIRDAGPVSLGVIPKTRDGGAQAFVLDVGATEDLSALAVSIEPRGGSPGTAPTGPVVLVSAL